MRVRRSPHDATPPLLSVHCIFGLSPISFISPSRRALQVILGLPLPLLPATSKFIQALTQSSTSFRLTCPNHLNFPRLITSTTPSIPSLLLSSTVGTLSLRVASYINLNITFSFLCILCSSWAIDHHNLPTRPVCPTFLPQGYASSI